MLINNLNSGIKEKCSRPMLVREASDRHRELPNNDQTYRVRETFQELLDTYTR